MKRVYTLYRVSTAKQVDVTKDDIPMQRIACHEFSDRQPDWEILREFEEKGVSGFKVSADKRDAIQYLKEAALAKEFDVLLVFMFDRLGRIENETPFVLQWFAEHENERVSLQFVLSELGYTGKYSLYDYLDNLDTLGKTSNMKHIVGNLLILVFIAMLWVDFSIGILGIVGVIIYNIVSYFKEKGEIDPYITSFAYIMRLMDACKRLQKVNIPVCEKELQAMKEAHDRMLAMQRNTLNAAIKLAAISIAITSYSVS